jgi:DNA-binding NtrC family response regulator
VQPKLLKVLEDHEFRRLGETKTRRVDIQLIAATHQDLREMASAKTFRDDLFFRLSTFPLHVPPLRERPEDIAPLVEEILCRVAPQRGRVAKLSASAHEALCEYQWPGNIRELHNVIERAALLLEGDEIRPGDLNLSYLLRQSERATSSNLEEMTSRHIEAVLREEGGRVARAAKKLGMPRSTLYLKIKQYGLDPSRH